MRIIGLLKTFQWTGHSDYKAMKPYIDVVDSIKASSMTKFDGRL